MHCFALALRHAVPMIIGIVSASIFLFFFIQSIFIYRSVSSPTEIILYLCLKLDESIQPGTITKFIAI
jgi:hypothetical protein